MWVIALFGGQYCFCAKDEIFRFSETEIENKERRKCLVVQQVTQRIGWINRGGETFRILLVIV
jgi:hypothetical protein